MHNKTKHKLEIIKNFIQSNYDNWRNEYKTVHGAYVGMKHSKNKKTGKYAIVFLVSSKEEKPTSKIPAFFEVKINEKLTKIPSDVVEQESINFHASLSDRTKRLVLGDFGTVGVFLLRNGATYLCTNAHVLIPDYIKNGQLHYFKPISQQIQPDVTIFNGAGQNGVAYLEEAIFNGLDAAIARVDNATHITNSIPGYGFPTGMFNVTQANIGYPLTMQGSVSGPRSGYVMRVGITISTPVPGNSLHNLVEVSIFSQRGDSGSPVFNTALKIAGIIIGGTSTSTYIMPITDVLNYFQCKLLYNGLN